MADALLEAVAAEPADDDARLVWADREGGERGELVVVQCALARGQGTREERKRLYARERELLAAAAHWPEAAAIASPRFERGFITHAAVKLADLSETLERYPLLASIELPEAVAVSDRSAWPRFIERAAGAFGALVPGRVATLTVHPSGSRSWYGWGDNYERAGQLVNALAGTAAGRALRGIHLVGAWLDDGGFTHLERWKNLEDLRVAVRVPLSRLIAFAATRPRLTRLAFWAYTRDADPAALFGSLSDLGLHGYQADLSVLAGVDLPNLRRLTIDAQSSASFHDLTRLTNLANLEALESAGLDDWQLQWLAESTFAGSLRELVLRDTRLLSAQSIPRLCTAFPKLDRLDLRSPGGDASLFAPVAEVVPWVAL